MDMYAAAVRDSAGIRELNIVGFIDCTVRAVGRPINGAVDSGHKKKHIMKYQVVMTPDGVLGMVFGPKLGGMTVEC